MIGGALALSNLLITSVVSAVYAVIADEGYAWLAVVVLAGFCSVANEPVVAVGVPRAFIWSKAPGLEVTNLALRTKGVIRNEDTLLVCVVAAVHRAVNAVDTRRLWAVKTFTLKTPLDAIAEDTVITVSVLRTFRFCVRSCVRCERVCGWTIGFGG